MEWTYCDRCEYAMELSDGRYYCTYHHAFERGQIGCGEGIFGYPRQADSYTEKRYEEWLSFYPRNTENHYTSPPSLLQIILDWFSTRRNPPTNEKEEQK